MPIPLTCPSCQLQLRVQDENAGRKARCKCGAIFKVPAAGAAISIAKSESETTPASAGRSQTDAAGEPITIQCPNCSQSLRAPASAAGKAVRCRCGKTITVPPAGRPTAAVAVKSQSAATGTVKPVTTKPVTTQKLSADSAPASMPTTKAATARGAARVAANAVATVPAKRLAAPPANPMSTMFDELTDADWHRESPIARAYAPPAVLKDAATLKKFVVEDSPVKDPQAIPGALITLSVINFIAAAGYIFLGVAVIVLLEVVNQEVVDKLTEVFPFVRLAAALICAYLVTWGVYLGVVGVGLLQRAPWGWCVAAVSYAHAVIDRSYTVVMACVEGVPPARLIGMVGGVLVIFGIAAYIYKSETRLRFGIKTMTPVIICAAIGVVIALITIVVFTILGQSADALVPEGGQ